MSVIYELVRRLRYWRHSGQLSKELQEELEFHVAMSEERNRERGFVPSEARRQAQLSLGNTVRLGEEARAAWIWPWLESIVQDARYALRSLRRQPGFAAAVVASLAMGIGANTAVFTIIQGLLLKDLPVREPRQLSILDWSVRTNRPTYQFGGSGRKDTVTGQFRNNVFSNVTFEALRDQASDAAEVLAFAHLRGTTIATAETSSVGSAFVVSGNFYQVLGVRPIIGRFIGPSDDMPNAEPAAVISYGLWRRSFGGSATALGSSIKVNGTAATVIGVTPPEFTGVSRGGWVGAPDVTLPIHCQAVVSGNWTLNKPGASQTTLYSDPQVYWLQLIARIRPEIDLVAAQAKLEMLFAQSESAAGTVWRDPQDVPKLGFKPGNRGVDSLGRKFAEPLTILMGVVAVILLIACANVANLMLARASARRREVAFRLALGASRARLVRQFLVESAVLASLGAAFGIIAAYPAVPALLNTLATQSDAIVVQPVPDMAVLRFTLAVLTVTVFVVGLAPALIGTRVNPGADARTVSLPNLLRTRFERQPVRGILVVAQVALSLVLLAGAGLFVRTFANLKSSNPGFRPEGLVVFSISPTKAGYNKEQVPLVYGRVTEALRQMSDVTAVSFASDRLLADWNSTSLIRLPERTGDSARKSVSWNAVGPGYFSATGMHLIAGREINQSDTANSPLVAVVNQTAARDYFDGSALGKRFYRTSRGSELQLEVVGVVADALHSTIRAGKRPMLYLPHIQSMANAPGVDFVVRTAGDGRLLTGPIREAIRRIDPGMPLIDLKTQTAQIDELMSRERMFATLTSFFACFALLLSCLGLYGVVSYGVARRVPEIGLRLALGASSGSIAWLFLRQALILVGCGVAIAIPLLHFATRIIRTQLFGIDGADPISLVMAMASMLLVSGTAALIPSWRAASVAPATVLRHD